MDDSPIEHTMTEDDDLSDTLAPTEDPPAWRQRVDAVAARIPLRWRVALVAFSLLFVLMGGVGMMLSLTEEHILLANQAVALRQEGQLAFAGQDPNPVRGLASANTRVTIYTANGTVVPTNTDVPHVPPSVVVSASAIQHVLANPPASDSYLVQLDAQGNRELVVLLQADLGPALGMGVVALSTPTAPIDHAVETTRLILLVSILCALLIAAAALLPLMSAALRPLRTMEATTRRIAAGDLSLRVEEPPTGDEVGQLARSFNVMVTHLDEAFARQKRFVADVSHELRTPLTALGGGLEMLLMGMDSGDPERGRRLLRGMYAEVERMRRLVLDLLTLARLDERRQALHVGQVEVRPLMGALAEEAQQLAHGQEVMLDLPPRLPAIAADPDTIRQVLLILIDNALKFTSAPGRVTLRARSDSDGGTPTVSLEVIDTGRGIAPDVLPRVFDRFYRADAARTRAQGQAGGSGLGLSIAQGLTEAMGGTISIESEPGQGTRAWLRFPCFAGPATNGAHPSAHGEGGALETPRLGVTTSTWDAARSHPSAPRPTDTRAPSPAITPPPPGG